MYPFLWPEVFNYSIPMYDLLIAIGLLFMILYVARRFEKYDGYSRKQTNKLLILLVASLLIALVSSFLFDGIFHSIGTGELTFGSITFIGGLIGGIAAFLVLLKLFYKDENKDVKKILNTIITGVVLAHAFGRIGCFFAGCCYGIPTDSFLGVVFPYGHSHIAYPDVAIFPTQLFEAAFLFILFIVMNKVKSIKNIEVEVYLLAYGVWRFLIEFIRGDDRGTIFSFITTQYNSFPTPSQYLSLLMIGLGFFMLHKRHKTT